MADVLSELLQNAEQNRINWENVKTAMIDKGIDVPDGTPTSEYGDKILSIESGVDTSGDTVVPSALREGFTAHDAEGQEITGTIPDYGGDSVVEMTSPDGATLNTAGTYCEGNIEVVPKLQEKTATTGEVVTPDAGYAGLKSVDTTPVFEAGKKSEYDAFWDAYQQNGNRTDYRGAFAGAGWSVLTFNPKYDIRATAVERMFYFWDMHQNAFDLAGWLEQNGITLDTSQCKSFIQFIVGTAPKHFPTIDTRAADSLYQFCANGSVQTFDKIIMRDDGSQNPAAMFNSCNKTVNLTIEGTIGQNGFNVSWAPLSKASLTSVVNALSSTTTGLTVTLRLAAVNTAFETTAGAADGSTSDEWTALIATKPNWTINLINS